MAYKQQLPLVSDVNGFDANPGSDVDVDVLTIGVTGSPTLKWIESIDGFRLDKGIVVGDSAGNLSHTINGSVVGSDLEIHSQASQDLGGITIHRHTSTAAYGAHIIGLRSDGSHASPTIVSDGDVVARWAAAGYDGTDYALMCDIRMEVDGTPGNNDMPGRIVFSTSPDGSQTPTEAMRINEDQSITLANALTVANGGTGVTSHTAYAVLCGGTTTTGPLQSIASVGTSGQVLTSNGAGMLPTFQDNANGDVSGPGSSTDNAVVRWDGAGGTSIQNSTAILDDSGNLQATSISFDAGTNLLDAYTTGTFTPTLTFGGGSTGITYAAQNGVYWKVGKIVYFNSRFQLSNKGSSTGNAAISMPFTSANDGCDHIFATAVFLNTYTAGATYVQAELGGNSASATLYSMGANTIANITDANFANNSIVIFSGTYWTA